MAESMLLQEADVTVTSARLVIGGETLPIPNITRVSTHRSPALRKQWQAIAVLLALGLPFTYLAKVAFNGELWFVLNLAVVAVAFGVSATRPMPLVLFVGMSDGGRELMFNQDDALVGRTHDAVTQAIAMRT